MPDPGGLLGNTARIIVRVIYTYCATAHQSGHADDHTDHYAYTSHANFHIYTHYDRR
jgi:hypothetical protein